MRVSLSEAARSEANAVVDWYLAEGAFAAAEDFADQFDHAVQRLTQFPLLGTPGRLDTRSLRLRKFPYSVIYRIQADTVRIIAVAHQRRRPGYWAGRR